jgi:hypothetical protein
MKFLSTKLETLIALEEDLQALAGLMHEMSARLHSILVDEDGVQPFEEIEHDEVVEALAPRFVVPSRPTEAFKVEPIKARTEGTSVATAHESPYARVPRHEQIAWLKAVLADKRWYSAYAIAEEYATDPQHLRYMKRTVARHLRELYEEGQVERRPSRIKGPVHEYRLK